MNKKNIANKISIYIIIILIMFFITIYISGINGYYEYQNHQKVVLTDEQIKQFEQDIINGENITLKDYNQDIYEDYSNGISNIGKNISFKIRNNFKKGIKKIFKQLGKIIDN